MMVSPFRICIELDIPRELLWRVRATNTFLSFLVSNGAMKRVTVKKSAQMQHVTTSKTRTLLYVPATVKIPDVISSLVDDSCIEVTDTQTWDERQPFVQHFLASPNMFGELVSTAGKLYMEQVKGEEGRCMHIVSGECSVTIPLLGYYMEQAIIANLEAFYETYSFHIKCFVDMVLKQYGNGGPRALEHAINELMKNEKPQ